jgi:hypothetical protein
MRTRCAGGVSEDNHEGEHDDLWGYSRGGGLSDGG